jgi:hypothetical protein
MFDVCIAYKYIFMCMYKKVLLFIKTLGKCSMSFQGID